MPRTNPRKGTTVRVALIRILLRQTPHKTQHHPFQLRRRKVSRCRVPCEYLNRYHRNLRMSWNGRCAMPWLPLTLALLLWLLLKLFANAGACHCNVQLADMQNSGPSDFHVTPCLDNSACHLLPPQPLNRQCSPLLQPPCHQNCHL